MKDIIVLDEYDSSIVLFAKGHYKETIYNMDALYRIYSYSRGYDYDTKISDYHVANYLYQIITDCYHDNHGALMNVQFDLHSNISGNNIALINKDFTHSQIILWTYLNVLRFLKIKESDENGDYYETIKLFNTNVNMYTHIAKGNITSIEAYNPKKAVNNLSNELSDLLINERYEECEIIKNKIKILKEI